MSLPSVRRMEADDVSRVYSIACASLDQAYPRGVFGFLMYQWPRGQLVSCDLQGNVTGFICGALLQDGHAGISLFAVGADHRGRGAGSALLEAFKLRCTMQGCPTVQLEVRAGNESVRAFYRRRGFAESELLPCFYTDGGDAVRMVCRIGQPS